MTDVLWYLVRAIWTIFLGWMFIREKDKFKRLEYLIWFGISVCV